MIRDAQDVNGSNVNVVSCEVTADPQRWLAGMKDEGEQSLVLNDTHLLYRKSEAHQREENTCS